MPLPAGVGQALASYLRRDRPLSQTRRVFICTRAPRRGFAGSSTVIAIVRRALDRATVKQTKRPPNPIYGQSRDQFVTAAYLFIDTRSHSALYSAAGHPPLLLSRGGKLERIESNGMVLGVVPRPDYRVCTVPIRLSDRFLLYTDGVIEPENAKGIAFGDAKLEQVVLDAQLRSPSDLIDKLLTEIHTWQPVSKPQQDDITVVVIDVH